MDACAEAPTVIEVAVNGAFTAGRAGLAPERATPSPLPVGSLAMVFPAAFAVRSVCICAPSAFSIWVTCAVQFATSVAVAAVVGLGSAPPTAELLWVTLMWIPGQAMGSGQGSPCHSVRVPELTLPDAAGV